MGLGDVEIVDKTSWHVDGFDLLEAPHDTRQFIRALDGPGHQPVAVIRDNLTL